MPAADTQLLASALRALTTGDATRALALVDDHASHFPTSQLAEERDAVRIRALVALGRTAEARPLVTRFLVAYPNSPHRKLIAHLQESP